MGDRATELFGRYHLIGHSLDHIRACHKHIAAVFDHEDEISHRRRIDRAASTGAHDHADLRHDAGGHDIALKHLCVTGQRGDALLNPCATRIV